MSYLNTNRILPLPSSEEIRLLGSMIEKYSGLHLGADKGYLMQSRLSDFAIKHELKDYKEIYSSVKNMPRLLFEMLELLTTNETFWFRDDKLWEVFEKEIIPYFVGQIVLGKKRPLKIWSAAAATGQEAYSMAIAFCDYFIRQKMADDCRLMINIRGTDLSPKSLKVASDGIYSEAQISRGPTSRLLAYMDRFDDTRYQLKSDIRKMASFDALNLLDPFHLGSEKFDIIFCRNVLIYFREDLKAQVVEKLAKSLSDKGTLVLGSSEFLPVGFSQLVLDERFSTTTYKLADGEK
ncbi:MAG: hypothetical protein A2504_11130 [Bdellovibrionales bacterium RIFOXYD12_FULL_39_22]|nr:MAG: hypothetical protein A2385_09695 [Bdellovibrionales bacterium RIFOXYB1_FULL_39_21]OFZ44228.1 MAG: hypothetical protein A2485_07315 [Bdellovibrionales bacterium RIFOXYC12_FULL_39_17]OFZ46770.1 MAG: hypothetical protein A2404_04550 [Bdellovibrionales bacterium RIFOXYC1_FULL_39_130]OFZ75953.1 MAG: hypothetical protein A2560_02600 [Bdellovibrionales bacterium RIFOXYD1_FULL_39_84]OFZ95449.1 MAG: hypothetical protein A2504_11130 [Bdellovibrionales bacterium RIFOXYD12_FULL_39_22]HLE09817.1 pr